MYVYDDIMIIMLYIYIYSYHLALESHENWGVVQGMSTDIQNQQEHHNKVTECFLSYTENITMYKEYIAD